MLLPRRALRAQCAETPVCLCWLILITMMVGCDRTAELAKQDRAPGRVGKLVSTDNQAIDPASLAWLEKCADAYARMTTYEDSARVVMSYKVDGRPTQDVAPLSIAYESPNRLGMKAYQVLAGSSQNRLRLRVESNSAATLLSRQVLSRELPKQLSIPWLTSDAVAVEHWSAGLAGSPPQLELLLGNQPFRGLLEGATAVALDGQGNDGTQVCQIIKIVRGETKFRLWINAANSILRRIELPTASLPAEMLADTHITDVRLSIELDEPRIGERIDWSKWQVPERPLDQLVRYFVVPPNTDIDARLGKRIPAFRLPACLSSDTGVDTSAAAGLGQVQIFIWLADHPSCQVALEQLKSALARVPEPLRDRLAPTVVWAEAEPPTGMTFASLKKQWHIDVPLVHDNGEIGRDVLAIAEAPTLVVLDSKHRLQMLQPRANPMLPEVLPDMLMRLVKGENLAAVAQSQLQTQQERFTADLWQARASDSQTGAFTQPGAYAFGQMKLEQLQTVPITASVLTLQDDAQHNLWLLQADGKLVQLNPQGKSQREFTTGLESMGAKEADTARIAVDDGTKYAAISLSPGGSRSSDGAAVSAAQGDRLHIIDLNSRRWSAVELGSQRLSDFRWLDTPVGLRLAAITSSSKTVLIDPARLEQHSGQSQPPPLALLPRVAEEALTSGYVILKDGRIEPLIVQDEGGAKAAKLAEPQGASRGSSASNHSKLNPLDNTKAAGEPALRSLGLESRATEASRSTVKQLQFTPAAGPWIQWRDPKHTLTLAKGWLASDEPAVFVLDDQLHQLWHAPLLIRDGAEICGASVATEPVSGQAIWVIATRDAHLHLFRADGQLVDHCQLLSAVRGVAWLPMGQELRLWVAQAGQLIEYRIAAL